MLCDTVQYYVKQYWIILSNIVLNNTMLSWVILIYTRVYLVKCY